MRSVHCSHCVCFSCCVFDHILLLLHCHSLSCSGALSINQHPRRVMSIWDFGVLHRSTVFENLTKTASMQKGRCLFVYAFRKLSKISTQLEQATDLSTRKTNKNQKQNKKNTTIKQLQLFPLILRKRSIFHVFQLVRTVVFKWLLFGVLRFRRP